MFWESRAREGLVRVWEWREVRRRWVGLGSKCLEDMVGVVGSGVMGGGVGFSSATSGEGGDTGPC